MADLRTWLAGARPRTLPAAVVPVVVGSGVAFGYGKFSLWRAALALVVALALQIGVNYANDYSDGIRGTDEVRVGPVRLVGSGPGQAPARAGGRARLLRRRLRGRARCSPRSPRGGCCYSARPRWPPPGSTPAAAGRTGTGRSASCRCSCSSVSLPSRAPRTCRWRRSPGSRSPPSAAIGLLACALLVINNLRDIPTDSETGKRTLAVVLGDQRTRALYIGCILVPFCVALVLAPTRPLTLLALAALPLALAPVRQVRDGATGRSLIVALGQTGRLELAYGALLTLGLAIKL